MSPRRLAEIFKTALPNAVIRSFERLEGGSGNRNYLLRLEGDEAWVVLRVFPQDAPTCWKEIQISQSACGVLPVPEIIYANSAGDDHTPPYLLYRFVEGITFQQLKKRGDSREMAEAAYAIGAALAQIQQVPIPSGLSGRTGALRELKQDGFASLVLKQRIGPAGLDRLRQLISAWQPRLEDLYRHGTLTHGDFNNRNVLVRREHGRWIVAGVLDWELAFAGSPLWDAARFTCYENPDRPCREPHFSRGFQEAGGPLPEDWREFSHVISVVSASESLIRPDLPERFVPELCELVAGAVPPVPELVSS